MSELRSEQARTSHGYLDMAYSAADTKTHLRIFMAAVAVMVVAVLGCADFGSGVPPEVDDGGNNGGGDTATVSFSSQIQPIFVANCSGNACHIPCRPLNGGGMCLVSHTTMSTAGVVIPGDAENSLMVQYLEGRQNPPMPYGELPLSDSLIQLIRTWIDEGAVDN